LPSTPFQVVYFPLHLPSPLPGAYFGAVVAAAQFPDGTVKSTNQAISIAQIDLAVSIRPCVWFKGSPQEFVKRI